MKDIHLEETLTAGLFKWSVGSLTGKVYVSPYYLDQNNSWVTWDDVGDRQLLEKRIELQARDLLAGEDPRD